MAKNKFTYWNRLESTSIKEDDTSPYEFRVRDPLWMLSRQWQMGEFEAEDNGTPIDVQCNFEALNVAGIKGSNEKNYLGIDLDSLPLESHVESIYKTSYSLQDAYQAGRMLIEIIEKSTLSSSQIMTLKDKLVGDNSSYLINKLTYIDDQELDQYYVLLLRNNQLDGIKLFADSNLLKAKAKVGFNVTAIEKEWKQRMEKVMPFVSVESKYWKEEQLEYEFDVVTAKKANGHAEYNARNYHNGSIDWFNFDYGGTSKSVSVSASKAQLKTPRLSRNMIPVGIRFPGMPGSTLWEIDNPSANLLNLNPEKTEILKLILTDFVLNYGNDWFDFPLTIENGRNVTIKKLIVKDVFGVETPVGPGDTNANFFSTGSKMEDSLFLLSTNTRKEVGKPLEKVIFARDEVANLVFGIEEIVPSGIGQGKPAATKKASKEKVDLSVKEKANEYKLKTEFQHNWIPFVLKEKNGSVLLQRASQIAVDSEGEAVERIRPKSILLRNGINNDDTQSAPYYIREEEVTKSGIVVQTLFQRTRWFDGKVVTWLSREKSTGHGEKSADFKFDSLV